MQLITHVIHVYYETDGMMMASFYYANESNNIDNFLNGNAVISSHHHHQENTNVMFGRLGTPHARVRSLSGLKFNTMVQKVQMLNSDFKLNPNV